jgi:hypothetical protein
MAEEKQEPRVVYSGPMVNRLIGYMDEGPWKGWLFARHPDGNWVSLCSLYKAISHMNELESRMAEMRRWVDDLQSHMFVNCVYCGHRYGPDPGTPVAMAEVLKRHIEKCPEHPLRAAMEKIEKLKDALIWMSGSDDFAPGGKAHTGWVEINERLLK